MDSRHLVIDAQNALFKGFFSFGRTAVTSADGRDLRVLLGFLAELLKAAVTVSPTHITLCFDSPGGCAWRRELFPAYKAGRPERPVELTENIPVLQSMLREAGFNVWAADGVEADDLVASAVTSTPGVDTVVYSSDKDLHALVTDRVHIIKPDSMARFDAAGIAEKYGVRPDRWLEFAALRGDSSDGLPGVRGIGDKAAKAILDAYPSVDAAVADPKVAEQIGTTFARRLIDGFDGYDLTYRVACLDRSVPFTLDGSALSRLDPATIQTVTARYDVAAIGRRVAQLASGPRYAGAA